jgi:hypothetical protein
MTTDFPTAPSAFGLNGPSAAATVEKSTHALHTEILTPPVSSGSHQAKPVTNTIHASRRTKNWKAGR